MAQTRDPVMKLLAGAVTTFTCSIESVLIILCSFQVDGHAKKALDIDKEANAVTSKVNCLVKVFMIVEQIRREGFCW